MATGSEIYASRSLEAGEATDIRGNNIEQQTWTFVSYELDWQHQILSELVEGLESLGNNETGLLADIRKRLDYASTLYEESIEDYRDNWNKTIGDIASTEIYNGLRLEPQLGLIPLGPDPESGCFEFAHLGSGELAKRYSKTNEVVKSVVPRTHFDQ